MVRSEIRTMNTNLIAAAVLIFSATACKGEIEGGEQPETKPVAKKRSNVVKLTTAVPYGKQVPCTDFLPDVTVFATRMAQDVGSVKDRGSGNSNASAVCSLVRGGEPAAEVKEAKTFQEKYDRLGVQPGDEFCMVTAYCSLSNDAEAFKDKCEKDGNRRTTLDGQFACLRETPKGPDYSYTYKFIEPDTKCLVEVMAGPSVGEQEVVRLCALATRDSITMAGVANPR